MVYLDNNASTKPAPEVARAVERSLTELWHNPSSVHRAGQSSRHALELARAQVAVLLGCQPKNLTFTSGGTESIDLAIRGTLALLPASERTLVTSPVEHSAVRDLAGHLAARREASVKWVRVTREGLIDLDHLAKLVQERPTLVSVQWCNNETGAIQPVKAIAELCRNAGSLFHCDAVQWVGKRATNLSGDALDPSAPGCDLLSLSAHKFHGPKGVGVLYTSPGVRAAPRLIGTQEQGRRGGTENVPGILGAGVAAELAGRWLTDPSGQARQAKLRDDFERSVLDACPGSVVNGPRDPSLRMWNTTNIAFPRLQAEAILLALSERGLCASAGAACSSGSLDPSPVLLAMGVPAELAHGALRFSLSRDTTAEEVATAARLVAECVDRVSRSMTPDHKTDG